MSKSDLELLSTELQKSYNLYKASEKALDVIANLKGLAQLEKELKASIETLTADKEKLSKSVKTLKDKEDTLLATIAKAEPEAENAVKDKIAEIIAQAENDAQALVAKAQAEADKAQAEADKLNADIAVNSDKLNGLLSEIDKAEKAKAKILSSLAG